MKTRFVALTLSLLALVLTGCSSLVPEAQTDPTRYYVLTAQPAGEAAAGKAVLGLRAVDTAAYLRSRSLVVRKGDNEVEFREFARWGEALDAGLARTLRENLLAADAVAQVAVVPFPLELVRDYDVSVRVLACEGDSDGTVRFRATWELWNTGAGADVQKRGDFTATGLTWDGRTEASLVAGLSRAVAQLTGEIATAIGQQ
jgi:uncharacterized lipoprotein YmbA